MPDELVEPSSSSSSNIPTSIASRDQPITDDQPHQEQYRDWKTSNQASLYVGSQRRPTSPHKLSVPVLDPIVSSYTGIPPSAVTVNVKENSEPPNVWGKVRQSFPNGSTRSKSQVCGLRRLCSRYFTAYRIFVGLTLVVNAVMLTLLITLDLRPLSILEAATINIMLSVLVRQEDLINVIFNLIAMIPSSLPLALRKIIANSHHYGGIHVGCALSALLWYILFVASNTRRCFHSIRDGSMTGWHWADLATCYTFLSLVVLICLAAIPQLREKFHNSFERTHRFGGWASILVLWINAGLRTVNDPSNTPLYMNRSTGFLFFTTFLVILPWLRITHIPVRAHALSNRELKLTFPYSNMPYTSTSRFSLCPLVEWHAFATIPSHDGITADIIISAAGDWTKNIITNPPERIWVRKPAMMNFLAFAPLFCSILLVATGAGIGPILSLLSSPAMKQMKAEGKNIKVMWCAYDLDAPHWAFVQTVIRKVDPLPKILDSKHGRPNVPLEARYLAHVNNLEAVMVVSNKKVTGEVIREVRAHGRAAYGAVFDS